MCFCFIALPPPLHVSLLSALTSSLVCWCWYQDVDDAAASGSEHFDVDDPRSPKLSKKDRKGKLKTQGRSLRRGGGSKQSLMPQKKNGSLGGGGGLGETRDRDMTDEMPNPVSDMLSTPLSSESENGVRCYAACTLIKVRVIEWCLDFMAGIVRTLKRIGRQQCAIGQRRGY